MVKFKIIAPPEEALPLVNRVVCDVCESRNTNPIAGKIVSWRGSVENEYFSILFLGGRLLISLVERECQLGHVSVIYAMSETLSNSLISLKDEIDNSFILKKEIDEISFTDVMVALNWRYAENAKIDYDLLTD